MNVYFWAAILLVIFGVSYAWLDYEGNHAPYAEEDESGFHYTDENGKRR